MGCLNIVRTVVPGALVYSIHLKEERKRRSSRGKWEIHFREEEGEEETAMKIELNGSELEMVTWEKRRNVPEESCSAYNLLYSLLLVGLIYDVSLELASSSLSPIVIVGPGK